MVYTHKKLVLKGIETFEKRSILFKSKDNSAGQQNWTAAKLPVRARGMDAPSQRENFNRRNTLSILRINPPKFGGGLKFEPVEAKRRSRLSGTQELGKRGRFAKVSCCNPLRKLVRLAGFEPATYGLEDQDFNHSFFLYF